MSALNRPVHGLGRIGYVTAEAFGSFAGRESQGGGQKEQCDARHEITCRFALIYRPGSMASICSACDPWHKPISALPGLATM